MKVYIWGTGACATEYLDKGELPLETVEGFIESTRSRDTFYKKKVFEPKELKGLVYDYILILVRNHTKDILDLCLKNDIAPEKILAMDNYEIVAGENKNSFSEVKCTKIIKQQDISMIKEQLPDLYYQMREQEIEASRFLLTSRNGFDLIEKDDPFQTDMFQGGNYQVDYFRYRTFELLANEIIRNNIEGAVAELGVFRGDFSRLINIKFMDRKLHLFDTFDSFDVSEFQDEFNKGQCPEEFFEGFKNTDTDIVLKRMKYPNQCVVHKGLFPSTADECQEERFAFVSVDVDFEKSILEGLRFFYPRLSEGGAIFVHDYNNRFLDGVKRAVYQYEKEIGYVLRKVPIADEGGTLIVIK